MRKQRKPKKQMRLPKVLENAKEYLAKKFTVVVVSGVSIVLAWVLVTAFLERSDYFKLRAVDAKGAQEASLIAMRSDILKQYKDKNIFKINLAAIAVSLEPKYPDAKEIIVKRMLPDKLMVDLKFRRPVALLRNGQVYPIDREGVILVNINSMKLKDFPVIKGIDPRLAGKPHKKNSSKNLAIALDLLDEIKKARFLNRYDIRIIDASDIKSLSFSIGDDGPVVIIGYEGFKDKLNVLRDTLRDPRLILDKINYIDVRFKDVAISPK